MSGLSVTDLSVRLDGFSLSRINFRLDPGEYLSVLGPSGSGKSVLLNTLAGFHRAEGGSILVDGIDISRLAPERRGIAIVYQDYALFPHLTVFDNIAYGLLARKESASNARRLAAEMAEAVGLSDDLHKAPALLSGGQKQRTALARALVVRPKLLVMDEPFSALDPPTRGELRAIVRDLSRRCGATVIHIAHDLDDTWALADRVLVLNDGAVEALGEINTVFGPPAVEFLRHVEGLRVVEGTVAGRHRGVTHVDAAGVSLASSDPAALGQRVRLILRPQDVTLHLERPTGASARNVLESEVTGMHPSGERALVGLRCGGLEFNALLTDDAVESLGMPGRAHVYATVKAVHLNVI